jgi:hypothetical protein
VALAGFALVGLLMPETRPVAGEARATDERHGGRVLAPA